MTMNSVFFRFILCCILLGGCLETEKKQATEINEVGEINFTVKEQQEMRLSTYFKNVKYVPLELTEESTIGNISKIEEYNEKLYVLDGYIAKSLLIFTKEGKYISRFGTQGRGPGEFTYFIRDFNIVEDKAYLLVDQNRVFIYDLNGDFIQEHRLKVRNIRSFFYKDGNWLFVSSGMPGMPDIERVFVCNRKFKVKKSYFTFNVDDPPIRGTRENFEEGDRMISYIPQCDTLYSFTTNGFSVPSYVMRIPEKNKISIEETQYIWANYKRKELVEKFREKLLVIMNIIFSDELSHVRYVSSGQMYWAMKNNDKWQLCPKTGIVNDIDKCSVLPRLYHYSKAKNAYVGILDPSELFSGGQIEEGAVLNKLNLTVMDNPIIAYYELK